ncbi:MAG: CinA family protein [Pseudomonadota bacterium]
MARLVETAQALILRLREQGLKVATAESCTGGLIVGFLTEISGSSAVVDRGFVTYSNDAKAEMLGVSPTLLERYGAVSAPVAMAMVEGALARSKAHIAVSVTGIAGPTGGSIDKPVGTVHFAALRRGGVTRHDHKVFEGDRSRVRQLTVLHAFRLIELSID